VQIGVMQTLFATSAVFAVAAAGAATSQGKCLLQVNGRTYIRGPCNVSTEGGGLSIGTQPDTSRRPITYFAIVQPDGQGFWNEERGANHAHTPLGTLTRNGACWFNQKAKVCAWR
jgi:hypothetical protein